MPRTLQKSLLALLVFVGLSVSLPFLHAQQTTMEIDPASTKIEFTLGDVLHTVHGSFRLKSGTISFNSATGEAGGSVVVDATSGDSGNKSRDRKMHKEILQSQQYPEISFSPNKIIGTVSAQGSSTVQVQGTFNLHGAGHPITLTVPVQLSPGAATATMHFVIPYVAWGLKNPSTFILRVSDKVEIDIKAMGHISSTAGSIGK
jgi:polyisoprenoid-binding protein YceI